jgi:hypothetical protein
MKIQLARILPKPLLVFSEVPILLKILFLMKLMEGILLTSDTKG